MVRGKGPDAASGAERGGPDNDRRGGVLFHSFAAAVVALCGCLEYDRQSGASYEAGRNRAHHRPRPSGPALSTYLSADGRKRSGHDASPGTNDGVRGHHHQHADEPTRALPSGSHARVSIASLLYTRHPLSTPLPSVPEVAPLPLSAAIERPGITPRDRDQGRPFHAKPAR